MEGSARGVAMWRGPFLAPGPPGKGCLCLWGTGSFPRCHISFYLSLYNFLSPPGSASPKPDEASTAVFFCSVLGDVPGHHPLHLHGVVWLHEVWVEHPGQHHSQLAQLLVGPCHPGWALSLSSRMWHFLGLLLARNINC